MADISLIAGAVSGLRAAAGMAGDLVAVRDQAVLQTKIIELNRVILDAQSSALAAQSHQYELLEQMRRLEKQLEEAEAWAKDAGRYQLEMVDGRVPMYGLKPGADGGEPDHKLCAVCFQVRRKSVLSVHKSRGQDHWKCRVCNTTEISGLYQPPAPIVRNRRSDW